MAATAVMLLTLRIGDADPKKSDSLEPVHRVEVLSGAFEILFPSAVVQDADDRWKWSISDGLVTLRVVAEELHALGPSKISDIQRFLDGEQDVKWRSGVIINKNGITIATGTALVNKAQPLNWNPILTALVINTDHTVQRLTFFVDPPGVKSPNFWSGISERIIRTIGPLSHRYDRKAGIRTTALGFSLKVPDDWILYLSVVDAVHTATFDLVLLASLGSPRIGCEIQADQGSVPKSSGTQVESTLLNRAVTWQLERTRSRTISRTTVMMGKHLTAISCEGPDAATEATARTVISVLKYVEGDDIRQ